MTQMPEVSAARLMALLLITAALLAVTIIFAKMASDAGMPMLWYQAAVTGIAGLAQLAVAGIGRQIRGDPRRLLPYALGAGLFQAGPSGMAYLAISHVGAGYISLTFAFPILITWIIARALGMERRSSTRMAAVLLGLAGGLLLAIAKYSGAPADAAPWIAVATAVPVVIACGNIYRTRFWPHGTPAILLAGLMLLFCALLTALAALLVEGAPPVQMVTDRHWLLLVIGNAAVFACQFVAYFILQRAGGPVALSQIGTVAAILGAVVAVIFFGERLPVTFPIAALLIALGTMMMVRSRRAVLTG